MKVSQIVSEHKKGVVARKYNTKAKSAVPVYGPDSKDAKLKPVKPAGPVKEAVLKAYDGKQATIDDPEHGKTINLDLTKPENAASLRPNDKGEIEFDATPDMATPGAVNPDSPLKPGATVAIKADEAGGDWPTDTNDIGGDPTDNFIDDVTDQEFERAQRGDPREPRDRDAKFKEALGKMLSIAGLR